MLTPLRREKVAVKPKKEVVKCPKYGKLMELRGVTRPNIDKYDSDDDSC
jgi:hypothetical protein